MSGEFDIDAARNAGLSDQEIAQELASHHNFDLSGALEAGHSYTDIANELAAQPMGQPKGDFEGDPVDAAIAGGALGALGATAKGTAKTGYDIIHRLVEGPRAPKAEAKPEAKPEPVVVEEPPVQPIEIPAENAAAEELAGKEKWNTKLSGTSVPGSQMDAESLAKNRNLMKAAHEMGGSLSDQGIILGPKDTHQNRVAEEALKRSRQARAEAAAKDAQLAQEARMTAKLNAERAAAAEQAARDASLPGRAKAATAMAQRAARPVTSAASKIAGIPILGPVLAGAGALGEGQDAYNRWQNDEGVRAAISGAGALGSAAMLSKNPVVKGIGATTAVAAPALNALIDKYYGHEKYAGGGKVSPLDTIMYTALNPIKSAFPANARALAKSIVWPTKMTESDFRPDELEAQRQAYINSITRSQGKEANALRALHNSSNDGLDFSDPNAPMPEWMVKKVTPTIQYEDYPANPEYKNYGIGDAPIAASFADPGYAMSTTVGRAKYSTDPQGNVHVIDTYDFPKGSNMRDYGTWSPAFKAAHGIGERFSNKMPVDINLGPAGAIIRKKAKGGKIGAVEAVVENAPKIYNEFGELMSASERLAERVKQRLLEQYPTNTATDPIKKPFENTVQARNKSLLNGSGPEPTSQDLRNDALIKRLQEQYGN